MKILFSYRKIFLTAALLNFSFMLVLPVAEAKKPHKKKEKPSIVLKEQSTDTEMGQAFAEKRASFENDASFIHFMHQLPSVLKNKDVNKKLYGATASITPLLIKNPSTVVRAKVEQTAGHTTSREIQINENTTYTTDLNDISDCKHEKRCALLLVVATPTGEKFSKKLTSSFEKLVLKNVSFSPLSVHSFDEMNPFSDKEKHTKQSKSKKHTKRSFNMLPGFKTTYVFETSQLAAIQTTSKIFNNSVGASDDDSDDSDNDSPAPAPVPVQPVIPAPAPVPVQPVIPAPAPVQPVIPAPAPAPVPAPDPVPMRRR